MNIRVQGGTHAGWKRQRQPKPWLHQCPASYELIDGPKGGNIAYGATVSLTAYSCPGCGARRNG